MATKEMSARVVRDFCLAVRGGPFRVALALSLVGHLVLLAVFGRAGLGVANWGDRNNPVMHVRLLPPEPLPAAVPAAAIKSAVPAPRRERFAQPTAGNALSPAAALPAPVAPVSPPAPEPAGAPAPDLTAREESLGQPESGTVVPAPASVSAAAAPQISSTSAAGVQGTGSTPDALVPETVASGSGESAAAGPERAGPAAPETAAGGAAAAATAGRGGPGLHDLAAVRRRIDAHKVYPRIAVRNGWQGRVLVEMRLEGDGSLTAVRLLEGSGYTVLDEATISAVRLASPFPPVARVLTVPVEYRLQ